MLTKKDLTFHKRLGKGSFGKVFLVSFANKKSFALKVVAKKDIRSDAEFKIAQMANHRFIINSFACFHSTHHVFLLMEYVPNKSLDEFIIKTDAPLDSFWLRFVKK